MNLSSFGTAIASEDIFRLSNKLKTTINQNEESFEITYKLLDDLKINPYPKSALNDYAAESFEIIE